MVVLAKALSSVFTAGVLFASVTSAASVWISCVQKPASTMISTKSSSLACDSFCYQFLYAFYDTGSDDCRCSNTPADINDMVGSTNLGGTCPDGRYSEGKISSPYGSFLQCLSNTNGIDNPKVFNNVPTVAQCWAICGTAGSGGAPTKYASYKAANGNLECQCFDSFQGNPTPCGAGNDYVWGYGPNVVVSNVARRRAAILAARQQALLEVNPFCPPGLTACRVPSGPLVEASYECIDVATELESCGGCLHGTMQQPDAIGGVDCALPRPGTKTFGTSCVEGRCIVIACLSGFHLVKGVCIPK